MNYREKALKILLGGIDFNEKFGRVKLVLVDNKMYFGFVYINMFMMKGAKYGDITGMFAYLYDEIELILSIVNEIKTNNKVFKM